MTRAVFSIVVLCLAGVVFLVLVTQAHGWRHCVPTHGASSIAVARVNGHLVVTQPAYRTEGC